MNKLPLAIMSLATAAVSAIDYPKAPKADVVDVYFGTEVADPYRPLENDTAAETLTWVEAERALTNEYFSKIPFRSKIKSRLESFQNYAKTGLPFKAKDDNYYFYENSGLKNQSVLYRKASLDAQPEVFLDPNQLSTDGTVALTGVIFSPDGKYCAYTVARNGSDWTEIYVMETASKRLLDDHITWAKFTGADWHGDGFFYSAYDKPVEGKEFSNANENHKVYYHKLGTPQSADTLFFEDPANPLHFHSAYVPEGSDYIFILGGGQGFGSSIMLKDLKSPDEPWRVMEPSQDVNISLVGLRGDTIYFTTALDAPRYRLMTTSAKNPSRENWKELVPQRGDAVLSSAQFAGDKLILTYNKDASDHLSVHDLDGKKINDIELPTLGTTLVSSDKDSNEVFYRLTSYLYPWANFSYDIETGKSALLAEAAVNDFNPADYTTQEVFYPSADGAMVHLFLTHKKDIKLDGSNPVYLYGYGGFNIGLSPSFSPNRLVWLENGGIYAEANLRGGSEYGDDWHIAGTKTQKLNVFNDFIAAAEYLVEKGYTNPDKIVIEGGSNGGLLVGACVNMRPDLFRVAIPRVGVMDMMRYHLFTIGWNWASDYGTSADSPEMANYLLGYSPLHNIKNDGTRYPAILVTTADHDDRVVPAHSFKYAATLQASDTGDRPKLIRIDSKAGHGAGKPIAKIIDEQADIQSFIFENLGMTPKK